MLSAAAQLRSLSAFSAAACLLTVDCGKEDIKNGKHNGDYHTDEEQSAGNNVPYYGQKIEKFTS